MSSESNLDSLFWLVELLELTSKEGFALLIGRWLTAGWLESKMSDSLFSATGPSFGWLESVRGNSLCSVTKGCVKSVNRSCVFLVLFDV